MNSIEKLTQIFKKFPGIGPRQASRCAYFLLSQNEDFVRELVTEIEKLKKSTTRCPLCFRFFTKDNFSEYCEICARSTTDTSTLLIVSKDVDIDAIDSAGVYKGRYFVLGGVLPFLEKNPSLFLKDKELFLSIDKNKKDLKEIIFALPLTPEGENTRRYLTQKLKEKISEDIVFTTFGRGLSTGTEIEYSDSDTIINAFKNRF